MFLGMFRSVFGWLGYLFWSVVSGPDGKIVVFGLKIRGLSLKTLSALKTLSLTSNLKPRLKGLRGGLAFKPGLKKGGLKMSGAGLKKGVGNLRWGLKI